MAEIIDFQKPTMKQRWTEFKGKVKKWADPKIEWCREHKEILMVIAPAVISGGVEIAKAGIKAKDHREERELEEEKLHSVYDRSTGMYLKTTRPPTNEDYIKIQALKREGKTTGEALYELDLLDI